MIVLNYNSTGSTTNNVVLELLSSASGTTPVYLFEVYNAKEEMVTSFIQTDISTSPCRNQLFEIITLSSSADVISGGTLVGQIYILPAQYEYTVYEVDSVSLTATKIKELQTGILVVKGTVDDTISIYV